jgi:pentatricopeptide repeat protein
VAGLAKHGQFEAARALIQKMESLHLKINEVSKFSLASFFSLLPLSC